MLQRIVTLGIFDACTTVMTLSILGEAPRRGHLDRARIIIGYLVRMKYSGITFCTELLNYSVIFGEIYSW